MNKYERRDVMLTTLQMELRHTEVESEIEQSRAKRTKYIMNISNIII